MNLKEIETAKKDYIDYLKVNNYSDKTILNYTLSIDKFQTYLKNIKIKSIDPTNINQILEDYKKYLKNTNKYADSTINQYITNLTTFLNKNGLATKVARIKEEKITQIKYLTPEEIEKTIESVNIVKTDTAVAKQFKAIICLMFYSGARVTEIEKLNINDIAKDNTSAYVILRGKGNKTIRQPITTKVYNMIQDIIKDRNNKELNAPLFINQYNKRLKVRDIQRTIKKIAIATDKAIAEDKGVAPEPTIESRLTPHALRHSYAIYLLMDKNRPINEVKGLLRHESITTTEKYLKLSNKDLRNTYNNIFN